MTSINLKKRRINSGEFCRAMERGKCCFNFSYQNNLCDFHFKLFNLLANDDEIIENKIYKIDYTLNLSAPESKCRIIEPVKLKTELIQEACLQSTFKKGICKRHFKILELIDQVDKFSILKISDLRKHNLR
ncbi:MAG: hypothetical protein COA79_13250 [Planctomycetota bacterium]|nr:MAG: hypothetical protein COA79_13250 [Planctomycetota bacterium]